MLLSVIFCLSACFGGTVTLIRNFMSAGEYREQLKETVVSGIRAAAAAAETYSPLAKEEAAITIPDPYNVLLIGTDRRQDNWNGNSDAIMLLSINRNRQTISLVSFMRDLGVNIPGCGYGKINSAYARGGAELLKQTMEQNFQITITNCASVDFGGMMRIVDLFGGVTIDVTQEEIQVMNSYIKEMCGLEGLTPENYYLSAGGTIHLNGMQAVAYCRNRYTGRYDFERTARQRRVMEQLYLQAKSMEFSQLLRIAGQAMPLVSHDVSGEQLTALISMIPAAGNYQVTLERVPYDGLYVSNNENLDPVWEQTLERLHGLLY